MTPPKSSVQRFKPQWSPRVKCHLLALVVATYFSLYGYLYLGPALREWGIDGPANLLLECLIVMLALLPIAMLMSRLVTRAYSRRRLPRPWVFATLFTAPWTGISVLILHSGDGWLFFNSPAAVFVLTAGTWTQMFRLVRRYGPALHIRRTMELYDLDDADDLISECRRELQDPSLSADERTAVEVNLAGALARASLGDRASELPEAYEILARSLNSSSVVATLLGAKLLVGAMVAKALRSGDVEGYEQALQLLLDAAANASSELPEAPSDALSVCAVSRIGLIGRTASDNDGAGTERLYFEAVADLERALEMSRRGSRLHALHTITLASIRSLHPAHRDLDADIKSCRRALLRLWLVGEPDDRWEGYLTLANLLVRRARLEPDGGLGAFMESLWPSRPRTGFVGHLWPQRRMDDLLRAARLYRLVRGELAPIARAQFVELTHLLGKGQPPLPLLLPARGIGRLYRQAFAEQARIITPLAVDQAERWSNWAAERQDAPELAEALWCWLTTAVAESRRRVFQAQKEQQLSQVQGLAAQAGASLLAAGRARDAAVALELGRAVLLTERMHRERDGLQERLLRAGRKDLGDRWRDVCERMSRMDRGAYQTNPTRLGASMSAVRADAFATAFSSAEQLTHADYEQLLQEIGGVPGCEDVDASPTYDDLRAAACDGPIVYLSATERGGYALIVTEAPDPIAVELASLRIADVDEHAVRLMRAENAYAIADELAAQLPWLWDVVMQPLVANLPPASLVTLIPVGALSQLPIHAAGAAPNLDDLWCDQTGGLVFRYAPNARVLLRAQAAGRGLGVEDLQLLTVPVADGPGERHLPRVVDESLGAAAQFSERRTTWPSPATVANVITALDGCDIWHFACHGRHSPDEPLDSYLVLADGPLTLRAIFARPAARGRLAVLSACQTAISDETLLDEVISFPSALLQNGIGGVVSSHSGVEDEAAMLLVLRFFSQFRSGVVPARALAEAQVWLRCATNGQIHDAFPDAYLVPDWCIGGALAHWRAQQRFTEPHNWAAFSYWGH